MPEEKITLEEALTAYTSGGARAGFMEEKTGTLESGKYADLVVLSQDLFQVDPVDIPRVQVEMTVVEYPEVEWVMVAEAVAVGHHLTLEWVLIQVE